MNSLPVLLFPGQGAQVVGMGRDVAEAFPEVRAIFACADDVLGIPLSKTIFEGPAEALVDTSVQQPALVLTSLALKKALELKLGAPLRCAAAAGLSLGEYAALAAVDALAFEDALRLVRRRGELMKQASERVPCGMAVVFKQEQDVIERACQEAALQSGEIVSIANFNGGGQIVIGGALKALEQALELLKAAGTKRVMKLPVSGAFHTALMEPAADGLREALRACRIRRAQAPVYANVSAQPVQEPEEIRSALERQLTLPVRWEQSVQNMLAAGLRNFLELGPGRTVSNMVKRIDESAGCQGVSTLEEIHNFSG